LKLKFLFWNTEKKDSKENVLNTLFESDNYDVIILGECPTALSQSFLAEKNFKQVVLNKAEREHFNISFYYKDLPDLSFKHISNINEKEEDEIIIEQNIDSKIILRTIKRIARLNLLELKIREEKYLLACVHFPSKKNQDEISQLQIAFNYKQYIMEFAKEYDFKVIVVGDFNMNPFDAGMVEPRGFYAISFAEMIREKRVFQGSEEMMFYNPCWWLLGDYHPEKKEMKTTGTHYYEGAYSKKLYWHLFDQVIISKKLIASFIHTDLDIIHIDEIVDELKEKPDRKTAKFSDHLPISFSLNL
jgi:exonuclease III